MGEDTAKLSSNSLSPRSLTLMGGVTTIISLMIGAGIFSSAGRIFEHVGSPAMSLIIWIATGALGLTGALCYAELGTMLPGSGGEHLYVLRAFGPAAAFLFDWTSIILLKPGTNAIFSVAFGDYMIRLFYEERLSSYYDDPDTYPEKEAALLEGHTWNVRLIAIAACLFSTIIVSVSVKWSDRFQTAFTFAKIAALLTVIIGGAYKWIADPSLISGSLGKPFVGTESRASSYLSAFDHGLWAYEGWNNLNIVSGDLVNPTRNLPLSIWISVSSVVVLYLLTIVGYFATIPKEIIKASKTIAMDFGRSLFGRAGGIIMPIFVIGSVFGSQQSNMISTASVISAACDTGHMPKIFSQRSEYFGTYLYSLVFQTFLSCCIILMGSFDWLVFLYTFPQWFFYASCVIALLKLRWTDPELERPYRVWITTPILFILACGFLIGMSFYAEPYISLGALGLILLGIPIWFIWVKNGGVRATIGSLKKGTSNTERSNEKHSRD